MTICPVGAVRFMARQKVWLSNKEYQKQKRLRRKQLAEREAQRAQAEAEWWADYNKRRQNQPKPSLGNHVFGTGERTKNNPTRSEERRVGKECRSRWSP